MNLLNEKETAARLNVVPGTLAKWRLTGEGPAFIKLGRRVCYAPDDIAAWIDARRVSSTSEGIAA